MTDERTPDPAGRELAQGNPKDPQGAAICETTGLHTTSNGMCVNCGWKSPQGAADMADHEHVLICPTCDATPTELGYVLPQATASDGELRDFLWGSGMFDKLNHDDHIKLQEFVSKAVNKAAAEARLDEVHRAMAVKADLAEWPMFTKRADRLKKQLAELERESKHGTTTNT